MGKLICHDWGSPLFSNNVSETSTVCFMMSHISLWRILNASLTLLEAAAIFLCEISPLIVFSSTRKLLTFTDNSPSEALSFPSKLVLHPDPLLSENNQVRYKYLSTINSQSYLQLRIFTYFFPMSCENAASYYILLSTECGLASNRTNCSANLIKLLCFP